MVAVALSACSTKIPATMPASCAFMLPVATAPNAIAYGTGGIEIQDIVKE